MILYLVILGIIQILKAHLVMLMKSAKTAYPVADPAFRLERGQKTKKSKTKIIRSHRTRKQAGRGEGLGVCPDQLGTGGQVYFIYTFILNIFQALKQRCLVSFFDLI